jgi:hypothetical protein
LWSGIARPEKGIEMGFKEWMKKVDRAVARLCGMSVWDLPDCAFAEWFAEGMSPKRAAKAAVVMAAW